MHWLAQAPANIALIKYMGKKDAHSNLPDNASLSYTLNNLLSTVVLEPHEGQHDSWELLDLADAAPFSLSPQGEKRFLAHLELMKQHFNYQGMFTLRSANNFPHSSGLASSASSFAALTRCAARALSELTQKPKLSINEQAQLSRQGSGSSCRSFYSPWVVWQGEDVRPVDLPYSDLIHKVILISSTEKLVSSSEAHRRVKTGALYVERPLRAEQRLEALLGAFERSDWAALYQICWDEFQDMHALFGSCEKPFSYITEGSLSVLHALRGFWDRYGDGPIVTMDAGPNIHLLYRSDQADLAALFERDYLVGSYDVL